MREVNNGVVVLLDALGVSAYGIQACKQFLTNRDYLIAEAQQSYLLDNSTNEGICLKVNLIPETFTFGDTIIFAWDFSIDSKCIPVALSIVSLWLARFIQLGIEHQILFRGAIGQGEYVSDLATNTILGKAVVDAKGWYEEADWYGVVLTPACGMSIRWFRLVKKENSAEYRRCLNVFCDDTLAISMLEEYYSPVLIEYSVPLKGNTRQFLWAVSWPIAMLRQNQNKTDAAERNFYSALQKMPIPKGTEPKYFNSIAFFDHCMTQT